MTDLVTFPPYPSGYRLVRGEDMNAMEAAINNLDAGTAPVDQVKFTGSSSGTTILKSAAVASGTVTIPSGTDTLVNLTGSQTITNKTLTLPTIGGTGEIFNGSTSGTTTLLASAIAGTTVQTLPPVTGVVSSTTGTNLYIPDLKRCSASVTKNASAAYANVTGLSFTVVPGTYQFVCLLPSTVASGTGGIKYAFNYTTAVISSIEATARGFTSSAVAVQHTTTTTTQTDLFTEAAVVIYTEITGTMVVGTGGTIDIQMAQNTSNASDTIALIGASAQFTRIA